MSHADALERYRRLPLPDTTEEHWRFTDLRGFDPDSFRQVRGTVPETGPEQTMLELDVAGLATINEAGVSVERAPEGITFAPLPEDHERLYSLVGWDEKFAAHNAAVWQHGLLVHVPKGVELEKPLYVRIANATADAALFWRLLVIADAAARRELEAKGVEFLGDTVDTSVCHMGFFRDPDGNVVILHRRYAARVPR